ncbi:MAG: hypothetical protein JNK73_13235 [Bacteroidia bacterium]|nr:hypothetical protein [Bacteroidia bacterium]
MALETNDIVLDADGEDLVKDGDFVVDDGKLDDCWIIFKLNKGGLKSDPILGPNLVTMMNGTTSNMKSVLKLNLERDGKEVKKLEINEGNIDFEI